MYHRDLIIARLFQHNSAKMKKKSLVNFMPQDGIILYPKKLSKKILTNSMPIESWILYLDVESLQGGGGQPVNPGVHGAWNSLGSSADPIPDPGIPPPLGHRITEATVLAQGMGGWGSHLLLPFTQSCYIHPSNIPTLCTFTVLTLPTRHCEFIIWSWYFLNIHSISK